MEFPFEDGSLILGVWALQLGREVYGYRTGGVIAREGFKKSTEKTPVLQKNGVVEVEDEEAGQERKSGAGEARQSNSRDRHRDRQVVDGKRHVAGEKADRLEKIEEGGDLNFERKEGQQSREQTDLWRHVATRNRYAPLHRLGAEAEMSEEEREGNLNSNGYRNEKTRKTGGKIAGVLNTQAKTQIKYRDPEKGSSWPRGKKKRVFRKYEMQRWEDKAAAEAGR